MKEMKRQEGKSMAIDAKYYTHEADQAALKALKAIPGFQQLLKAWMKVWNERQYRIMNMSSRIRISEKQLPKYYRMLPPICEKLGIEVPELYLELNVVPNAYTSGDTVPFIVITSGLLEMMPEELIPTVLAHECGHIACHHVLYRTMGRILLGTTRSAVTNLLPHAGLLTMPLVVGFYYWMRCSEFSADRAAVICDGTAEKLSEVCMRFAGFDKDIDGIANKEEFMNQAKEYREMVKNSTWDKTLEFFALSCADHPLTAVRALECEEWAKSAQYLGIMDGSYMREESTMTDTANAEEDAPVKNSFAPDLDIDAGKPDTSDIPEMEFDAGEPDTSDIPEPEFDKGVPEEEAADAAEILTTLADEVSKAAGSIWKRFREEAGAIMDGSARNSASRMDEIRKYKELMDEGIISEEEFEQKKKQLLGL